MASKGRSGLKIAHAVGFYPQAQKMSLGWGYVLVVTHNDF